MATAVALRDSLATEDAEILLARSAIEVRHGIRVLSHMDLVGPPLERRDACLPRL